MIRINEITTNGRAAESGIRFSIETPRAGTEVDGLLLPVEGWAALQGEPPLKLVVIHDGSPTAVLHADERRDVVRSIPGAPSGCGFHADVLALGLAEKFTLKLVATTAAGRSIPLAEIHGQRTLWHPPSSAESVPVPILVTSLGRTGTSWLQHVLGTHAEITGHREWPHELSAINYWVSTLRRIVDKPHGIDLPSQRVVGSEGTWWLGASPFDVPELAAWYPTEFVNLLARTAREGIQSVYRALAESGSEPRYFVEKTLPNADTNLMRELFPEGKEIVLVRDFRDMLVSILSFNRRRGHIDFGREQVDSDADYVRHLTSSIGGLRLRAQNHPEALVVRYEDLVTDPPTQIGRMLTHLGLGSTDADVQGFLTNLESESEAMTAHRTSDSPAASVGRWRSDLPADLADLATGEWTLDLEAFGYL